MVDFISAIHRTARDKHGFLKYTNCAPMTFCPVEDWIHNPDLSAVQEVDKKYWNIVGDTVVEMNAEEKAAVDMTHLPSQISSLFVTIDEKTRSLIRQGFTYDGEIFSLSEQAQSNWLRMQAQNAAGTLTFPIEISTINDQSYEITDQTSFDAFCAVMNATIDGHIESGRAQKEAVREFTTVAEVTNYVDPR